MSAPASPGTHEAMDLWVAVNRAAAYGAVARDLLHDLRGPSQALALLGEFSIEPDDPMAPELWQALAQATPQLTRTLRLLGRTLRKAAEETPAGPVSLPDLLRFLVAILGTRKGAVRFSIPAAEAQLPAVTGIEAHLEHALLNLVLNALDALGKQAGEIVIAGAVAGSEVELLVDDSGPGVAPAIRDRLFQPFVTSKPGAWGLGLCVARHLVVAGGGSVDYRAGAKRGARLVVRLPVWAPSRSSELAGSAAK